MSENVQNIRKNHEVNLEKLEVRIDSGRTNFSRSKIQRDIIIGNSLLPLLFDAAMMPLNYELMKYMRNHTFTKSEKNNQLVFKVFKENE